MRIVDSYIVVPEEVENSLPRVCVFTGQTENLLPAQFTHTWQRNSFMRPKVIINFWLYKPLLRKTSIISTILLVSLPAAALGMYSSGIHWVSALFLSFLGFNIIFGLTQKMSKQLSVADYVDGEFYVCGSCAKFRELHSTPHEASAKDADVILWRARWRFWSRIAIIILGLAGTIVYGLYFAK